MFDPQQPGGLAHLPAHLISRHPPMILRRATDPLAVADDQVAQLAVRIELVERYVSLCLHRDGFAPSTFRRSRRTHPPHQLEFT